MEVQAIYRKTLQTVCLLLAIWLSFPYLAFAADDTVDRISVQIISSDATQVPPVRIAKRMSASVNTIGENLLIGHKVAEVADKKNSYEKLVREVFDRILVGYSVTQVVIIPGESTHIKVEVSPWGEVVHDVSLDIDYGSLSPEVIGLIKQDMGNIEEQINSVLLGLPIDAVDWAGGVAKSVIRELLAAQLPEFRSNLEVIPGSRTIVKLALLPQGITIQEVQISLRSSSIPNILLLQAKPAISELTNGLIGLPTGFVERHRDYFTAKLHDAMIQQPVTKRYGLTVLPAIQTGSTTEVNVNVETAKYNVSLEGYLDFGREQDSTSAKLHVGKYTSSNDEAFVEVDFVPSTVSWRFIPGWGHRLSSATTIGLKYVINDQQEIYWVNQDLGENWMLRLERKPQAGNSNELGVRYKIHEFLSAEYIFADHENWLRLVGHL